GRAGGAMGARRRAQDELLVGRDLVGAGRDLDDAGADLGAADALGELAHEEVDHLGERVAELDAELEVGRRAEVLLVEAGGADDADAALVGHLGHPLDVAPEVDRARIEEAAHADGAQLLHALDSAREARAALVAAGLLGAGRLLVAADPLPPRADAIVILAGSVPDRTLEAADLYRAGLAPRVVVTRERLPRGQAALRARGVRLPESDELT